MHLKYCFLYVLHSSLFSATVQGQNGEITNICYNSSLEGFRLNATVLMVKVVSQRIDCVIECATEPCCRSINYKKTSPSQNESNCEILHHLVYNTSETLLDKNSSYDYVYLVNPIKEYNESCSPNVLKEKLSVQNLESYNLSSEPQEFIQFLQEWVPETGNWSICWVATRDGWDNAVFHSKCDRKIPTLTFVKVVNNNKTYVFGGYSTVSWAGNNSWTSAPGSFLFSLRNHDDLAPFKAPLKDENYVIAIYRDGRSGPSFGLDLHIGNDATFTDFGYSFQPPPGYTFNDTKTQSLLAGSHFFTPAEIVVLYFN